MWEPSFFPPLWMGDEMYHVKHLTPTVLGKFDAVSVYIPDQLPAVSDLTSTGIPAWWRTVCWNSLSARRPPDVPASGNVCCSFGAQVPPHLLSSCWHTGGGELLPLKGFVVYIQPYGITLSSVLTAKHDSTANFWPEIKPLQNDRRQTSSLRGYYQTGAPRTLDEGNKVIFFSSSPSIIWLWEMVFRPFLLHFTSLQHLQPSYPSKARRVTVNQDDNVLVCMPSANYWVNHSFSAHGEKKMLLIRGLSNLQRVGVAVARRFPVASWGYD